MTPGGRSLGFVRMETAIKTGDVETAVRIGHTAAAFRQLDDSWGLSATLYHLGWGLRQFGRFEEGARALEEAIDVAQGAGLWNTAQWALADLAVEKVHLGDHDTARRLFDEAASASREIGDGAGEVLAGYGYGLLAHVDGAWDQARRHYAIAVDGFIDLGTPVLEGVALAGLGRCHEADGDTAAAQARYQEALELGRRLGEPSVTASALEGLARLALAAGDRAAATARFVERPASRNGSTGPHHRTNVTTSSISSMRPDAGVPHAEMKNTRTHDSVGPGVRDVLRHHMAVAEGFEPSVGLHPQTLSRRSP